MNEIWKKEKNQQVLIIHKIKNWEIGLVKFNSSIVKLMVRGNWYKENPILYTNTKRVSYDRPENIPDSVKKYILDNIGKLYDLLRSENNQSVSNHMLTSIEKRKW